MAPFAANDSLSPPCAAIAIGASVPATACVVCGDTMSQRKPHPAPLLHAAGLLGLEPRACVYVGDAERDVQAGRAAGMHTLIALFGYLGAHDRPEEWRADGVIREPAELLGWLNGSGQRDGGGRSK